MEGMLQMKSLTKIKKRRDPKTEPCGILEVTFLQPDTILLLTTFCLLLLGYDSIDFNSMCFMP